MNPAILAGQRDYYAASLAAHGPGARGVDWNGAESQARRFAQFLRLLEGQPEASVLDLGCGCGDLLPFLRAAGHRGPYQGWDLAPEMVAAARARHGEGPGHAFHLGAVPAAAADFALASGVLHVKGAVGEAEWAAHAAAVQEVLAGCGRRGFGWNMLSRCSDPGRRRPHLFYADPVEELGRCLGRFGRHVALLQDYGLWEFTLLVRRGEVAAPPVPS
ncbi:methyltransferase domain-containing protein [Roseococcus sp. DSY-14]|uniref:methyltransferase domain-containing protein n=1 Tax=Roseococcus sp. DSY-14 TaxID=3369650 RepID=UPI00387B2B80